MSNIAKQAALLTEVRAKVAGEVRFKQLLVAPFTSTTGSSYSMYGLSEDGKVYRFDPGCDGWIPWSMSVAPCKEKHKAKR